MLSAPFSILACPFAFPRHSSHSCFRPFPLYFHSPPFSHSRPLSPFPPYSHSREGGNLPVSEAGRATLAPPRFVICAGGARIGRFPPSREWGVRLIFVVRTLFYSRLPFCIPPTFFPFLLSPIPPLFPFPPYSHSPPFPIPAHFPHSREGGNLPVAEAGRATLAPPRFLICADGARIGRFPPSREWGVCLIFVVRTLFYSRLPFCIPSDILPIPAFAHSPSISIPPLFPFPPFSHSRPLSPFPRRRESPCG